MANNRRDPGREAFWRVVVKRWAGSGLSVRGFCRREGLAEWNFYAWRRTLAQRDAEPKRPKRSNGRAKHAAGQSGGPKRSAGRNGRAKRSAKTPAFVPVVVADGPPCEAGFVIELAGGRRLLLPQAIAAERLAAVAHALEVGGSKITASSADSLAAGAQR